jgi:hypothetical protein
MGDITTRERAAAAASAIMRAGSIMGIVAAVATPAVVAASITVGAAAAGTGSTVATGRGKSR